MEIMAIVMSISALCSALIPIITFGTITIPKIRKKITLAMKEDMGIDSIRESINDVKDDFSDFKQEYYDKHQDLTDKVNEVENKIAESNEKMNVHLQNSEKRMQTDLCLLRETLITKFKYLIEQGYVTYDELESIQIAYIQYREMGGNGVIKHKWETEILKLPVR